MGRPELGEFFDYPTASAHGQPLEQGDRFLFLFRRLPVPFRARMYSDVGCFFSLGHECPRLSLPSCRTRAVFALCSRTLSLSSFEFIVLLLAFDVLLIHRRSATAHPSH